jgi:hypothetical protein
LVPIGITATQVEEGWSHTAKTDEDRLDLDDGIGHHEFHIAATTDGHLRLSGADEGRYRSRVRQTLQRISRASECGYAGLGEVGVAEK